MKEVDQATFLFDNQYHPEVIDKVYHKIHNTTWDQCMNVQRNLCQQTIRGGPIADFKLDADLNARMKFPIGSYTMYLPERLLQGNQKYILENFTRNKNLLNLRDMLQDDRFTFQYIFRIAEYVFMNLKCCITQNGTYMVIPIDTPDGITAELWANLYDAFGNPYAANRWLLESRPKVSYGYAETTTLHLLQNNRIYLDQFAEKRNYLTHGLITDWKVCVSDRSDNLPLMRTTPAVLCFDATQNDAPYLEVSTIFADYLTKTTFNVNCFIYNEGQKVGNALSPNYIGPTQYLKSMFDEYLATVESRRMKVLAMDALGGWTSINGDDVEFSDGTDLVQVGFEKDQCWIALPTKNQVAPIYPSNFRVWEYNAEQDCLGRMIATDMTLAFPNIYLYKMKSEVPMLYIEWYRDDHTIGPNYEDITKKYRDYVGQTFAIDLITGLVPDCIKNFKPLVSRMDVTDFVKHILMYSYHEYRITQLTELLQETGLHYQDIVDSIDDVNSMCKTLVYDMAKMPTLYAKIQTQKENAFIQVASSEEHLRPYDLYIDGLHIAGTNAVWREFTQVISIPYQLITPTSKLIVDLYDYQEQASAQVNLKNKFENSLIPSSFPIKMLSGSDIVVTDPYNARIAPSKINFGMYATEILMQVPVSEVDWTSLGITKDDPRIASRLATSTFNDHFQSIVFRLIVPTEVAYVLLKTGTSEAISTLDKQILMVKGGEVFVTTEDFGIPFDHFSKKVDISNVTIRITGYTEPSKMAIIHNSNVHRHGINTDLQKSAEIPITAFCGAQDTERLLPFVNGILQRNDSMTVQYPPRIRETLKITLSGTYQAGDIGEVVYLPYPIDTFEVTSNANSQLHLENTGVMVIGSHDMIFENGKRILNEALIRITNQLVLAPTPNAKYTIIRIHRDSNLYGFQDTATQSFLDQLYQQSPGFKQNQGIL